MSNYNSENTTVLATHEEKHCGEVNKRMLLLHICESGRHQYIIGSYFTEIIEYIGPCDMHPEGVIVDRSGTCIDVAAGHIVGQATNSLSYQDPEYYAAKLENDKKHGRVHYSWYWGHYFEDVVKAVRYWESEVLRKPTARKMVLEDAWKRFGDTPIDDSDRITEPFWLKPSWSYPAGVSRFEIWDAFDELYAEWGGVHALAYPSEQQ